MGGHLVSLSSCLQAAPMRLLTLIAGYINCVQGSRPLGIPLTVYTVYATFGVCYQSDVLLTVAHWGLTLSLSLCVHTAALPHAASGQI